MSGLLVKQLSKTRGCSFYNNPKRFFCLLCLMCRSNSQSAEGSKGEHRPPFFMWQKTLPSDIGYWTSIKSCFCLCPSFPQSVFSTRCGLEIWLKATGSYSRSLFAPSLLLSYPTDCKSSLKQGEHDINHRSGKKSRKCQIYIHPLYTVSVSLRF